jgi:D-alanine transaminase
MKKVIMANYNGKIMPLDEVAISPLDRGYVFGDAVYEVIRVYEGKMWLAEEHLNRLKLSLQKLEIEQEISVIESSILSLFNAYQVVDGYIYVQISRGTAPRTHYFPLNQVPSNFIMWIDSYDSSWLKPLWTDGIKVITHEDLRWARRDIKTVNLLGNCMAMEKAKKLDAYEAILIDRDGIVSEATSNNVFRIKDGKIITTPCSRRILPGITRQFVIELAKNLKISIIEEEFDLDALLLSEEVFLTGSIMEIMPVCIIDDQKIGNGNPGEITKALQDGFKSNGGRCL